MSAGFWRRTRAMAIKEFRQALRDKLTLAGYLGLPVLLLLLFGYALSFDVVKAPLSVWDEDRTPRSREFARSFFTSDAFVRGPEVESPAEAEQELVRGTVQAVLAIPRGYSQNLSQDRLSSPALFLDGSDAGQAAGVLGFAQGVARTADLQAKQRSMERQGRRFEPPVQVRVRTLYNPELRTRLFMVPGLMAYLLVITAVVSTVLAVVRERERGTFEQLQVSPVRPLEVILGKLAPYVLLSVLVACLVLAGSVFLFGMPLRGDPAALVLVVGLFLILSCSQGLFLSTLSDRQESAFSLAAVLTILPSVMLSGFIYPIRNMPLPMQGVTYLFPGRYLISALRSLMLRDGTGLSTVWVEVLAMSGYTVGLGLLAARRLGRILR